MLLEDAGVEYTYSTAVNDERYGHDGFPTFAPPLYKDPENGVLISQTTAILSYLGAIHGYQPEEGGPISQAQCHQLGLDIADVWAEAYRARNKDADRGSGFCTGGRLQTWITHLDKALQVHSASSGPYFFGEKVTWADFALHNLWNTLVHLYGSKLPETDLLLKHYEAMKSRPALTKYYETSLPVLYASNKADS